MMKRPDSSDPLPSGVDEHLTRLLELWANTNRLPVTRAMGIREAVQEHDGWNQQFWTRMNPALMRAMPVVKPALSKLWNLTLPIEADLTLVSLKDIFDAPDFCPYLRFGS